MTDKTNISPGHTNVPPSTAQTFRYGGGEFVATETLIADHYSDLSAGPYQAFNHVSTSGHDVTIDTGEAVVGGAAIARDIQTTVTLQSATSNQTVYAGWNPGAQDTIIIGLDSDFSATDFRAPIWEFDTDSSTVTSTSDLRNLGPASASSEMWYSKDAADSTFVSKSGGGLNADLDFQQHQALNMIWDHRQESDAPSSPANFQVWVREDLDPAVPVMYVDGDKYQLPLEAFALTIDGFESGGLASWSGDTGSFNVQSGTVKEGSYALEGTSDGIIRSMPGDGLEHYPEAGDSFEIWVRGNQSGSQPNVFWCVQGDDGAAALQSSYYLDFRVGQSELAVLRFDESAGATTLFTLSGNYSAGDWVRAEVNHGAGGSIEVTLDETFVGGTTYTQSATDSNYSSGGVQLRKRDAGNQYFDGFQIIK